MTFTHYFVIFLVSVSVLHSTSGHCEECVSFAKKVYLKDSNFARFTASPFFWSRWVRNHMSDITAGIDNLFFHCQAHRNLTECFEKCPSQNIVSTSPGEKDWMNWLLHYNSILEPICLNLSVWNNPENFESGSCMAGYAMGAHQNQPYENAVNGDKERFRAHSIKIPLLHIAMSNNAIGFPLWEKAPERINTFCRERVVYLRSYEPIIRKKCRKLGADVLLQMHFNSLHSFGRLKNVSIDSEDCRQLDKYVAENLGTEYTIWKTTASYFRVVYNYGLEGLLKGRKS
ncbi:hypothetical protein DdX_21164 [Ditylenchus destructor]|uniref:Uncharacterized protein n=1 Tax=Ditylenchus destructor TaxID=166010 RepID=A0AAD4MFA0_9BILA|nr:hypothetical protein DdX_21164 [Ditylenchus destructor]